MPRKEDTPSIGSQLADALDAADVSQKELARRLATADGAAGPESKRRWILKLLADDVARPNMAEIEAALSLPAGHFVLPAPEETERRRVRLSALEAEIAQHYRMIESAERTLESLNERIEALERRAQSEDSKADVRRG